MTDFEAQAEEMMRQRNEWRAVALRLKDAARAALPVLIEDRDSMEYSYIGGHGEVTDPEALESLATYDWVIADLQAAIDEDGPT